MSSSITIAGVEIPQSAWDTTPESVKLLVTILSERLADIEEQLHQNSQNSSRPPSSDRLSNKPEHPSSQRQTPKPRQKKTRRAKDASKATKLYPIESCAQVHKHVPHTCAHCGEPLKGKDTPPSPSNHRYSTVRSRRHRASAPSVSV